MNTELVAEHTIACLPKSSGMVLDVGCRHFDFSKAMLDRGYSVVVVEADDKVVPMKHERFRFGNHALVSETQNGKTQTLVKFGNGTANHLLDVRGEVPKNKTMNLAVGLSITALTELYEVEQWDVIKLDCEGAEYDVLLEWPGSVTQQITVEFHEHTGANVRGKVVYDDILKHLSQWYKVIQHEKSVRHCLSTPNYWDTLLIRK